MSEPDMEVYDEVESHEWTRLNTRAERQLLALLNEPATQEAIRSGASALYYVAMGKTDIALERLFAAAGTLRALLAKIEALGGAALAGPAKEDAE